MEMPWILLPIVPQILVAGMNLLNVKWPVTCNGGYYSAICSCMRPVSFRKKTFLTALGGQSATGPG